MRLLHGVLVSKSLERVLSASLSNSSRLVNAHTETSASNVMLKNAEINLALPAELVMTRANGVDPVPWTRHSLCSRSRKCPRSDRRTRRSSDSRWSSWCVPGDFRAAASGRKRTSRPGGLTLRRFRRGVNPRGHNALRQLSATSAALAAAAEWACRPPRPPPFAAPLARRCLPQVARALGRSNRAQVLSHYVGLRRHQGAPLLDKWTGSPSLFQDFQRTSARPGSIHRNRAKRGSQSACVGTDIAITR